MTEKVLFQPLRPEDERDIIRSVFALQRDLDSQEVEAYREYLTYYRAELQKINFAVSSRHVRWTSFVVRGHAELASVLGLVSTQPKEWKDAYRPCLRRAVQELFPDRDASTEDLNRCLDLAIRLLTMMNVREPAFALQTPGTPLLQWDDNTLFADFLAKHVESSVQKLVGRDRRLHPLFTVVNMASLCGLRVEWTQSLADHLRLDRRAKVLRVFPYKSSLLRHLDCVRVQKRAIMIPEPLIEETLETLDLLFPFGDGKTIKFLSQNQQSIHEEGPFSSTRTLDLNDFTYWRDRLRELHEEIFHSPPERWLQLWLDRRNPQQWLTLWIAFVVFLLTIISTAASIVQAWAAVKALNC